MLSKDGKRAIVYVMPGVILSALIVLYPLLYIVVMSFSSNGFSMGGFVGFKNYVKAFTADNDFLHALGFTSLFTIVSIVTVNVFAFALALLLTKGIKGTR